MLLVCVAVLCVLLMLLVCAANVAVLCVLLMLLVCVANVNAS